MTPLRCYESNVPGIQTAHDFHINSLMKKQCIERENINYKSIKMPLIKPHLSDKFQIFPTTQYFKIYFISNSYAIIRYNYL